VVLYGALRSGTTLLRLILDAHPAICCPGERDFMLDALRPGATGLEIVPEILRESRIFLASELSLPEVADGRAAFESLCAEDRARSGKPHLVLVMHRRLDRLLELHPETRFIHLLRDPRDVARSSIGMGWAGNTWFGIDHWLETESDWERHGAGLPPEQVCLLRYEELLGAPEETLTRVCAFLGVAYDPAMLTFAETSTYEPLDPKLAYQWRRRQRPDEIANVEHKIGALLEARGYSSSGMPQRGPDRLKRLLLTVQNRVHVWKFRLQRFGFVDPVIAAISRRSGVPALGKGAQARLREKQKKYLK
jgi:hypothetical protein